MHIDPTTTIRNTEIPSESVLTTGTSPPSKLSITLIVIPLCVLVLCTVAGFAGICILLKLNLIRKRLKESSIANQVNQTYYEIIDPIYETIPSTDSRNLTQDFGITTMSNDAYNNIHSQEAMCCHSPPLDFNASSNEAYVPGEKVILPMQNNSSYLAASQFMTTVMESEGPTKKHQCYDKQSIENIQQTEVLCSSVKCASPKHVFN
jgi:hypothetical protein